MTDWRIVQLGDGDSPTLVAAERTYVLQPGDSHFYDVGAVPDSVSAAASRWPNRVT
jgi:hypothetical protein